MRRRPIRVLMVDDSALVRRVLSEGFAADPSFEIVGVATNPYEARDLLVRERPDVMTLDIEMPRMDGITFLRKFMAVIPTPTVVVSNLTTAESKAAVEALAAGAVDVLRKPRLTDDIRQSTAELLERVRAAAAVDCRLLIRKRIESRDAERWGAGSRSTVIAIGASTGGVQAVAHLLPSVTAQCPPIIIAQHMPFGFTSSLAARFAELCPARVVEAEDGMPLETGKVIVAAANDRHTVVERAVSGYRIRFRDGEKLCYQRPAVDALFESIAESVTHPKLGVLLTGMGSDGARGLLAIRNAGGRTVCQDQASSAVYGMPGAAWQLGAAERQCSLQELSGLVAKWLRHPESSMASIEGRKIQLRDGGGT